MLTTKLKQKKKRFIDRTARRPGGGWAIKQYNDPKAHYRSFKIIMDALDLTSKDNYCEIGCGGGVLLRMAMEKAGRGAALDHSPDMVALAGKNNQKARDSGRLEIVQGSAEALPWDQAGFSACASANMFFFVEQPQKALGEIFRILEPGGRFSMVTAGKSLLTKITMGWLYNLNIYSDANMAAMMKQAGFKNVRVKTRLPGLTQVCYGEK